MSLRERFLVKSRPLLDVRDSDIPTSPSVDGHHNFLQVQPSQQFLADDVVVSLQAGRRGVIPDER